MVFESHSHLSKVFEAESCLTLQIGDDKYGYERRGALVQKVYSREFSKKYQEMMGNMVEDRMLKAINFLGDMIYTAWVDSGQPDLLTAVSRKIQPELTDSLVGVPTVVNIREHE